MINFNKNRNVAVVYPCGICNLNCRYCTIDKNPALLDIDKELEKSFEGDYYFNRIKAYFPRKDQLKRVETWGGEPFLHMERVYPLVHKLINYYPYFNTMHSSTNFSFDEWIDKFMGLMNCFAAYPYRKFHYHLQLSVDGPPYINDANRGTGVTERCLKNFDRLIEIIQNNEFPENVSLLITLKGTWDVDCIKQLNSKEKLIEFFQFYENNYIDKVEALKNPNITIDYSIPNTAIPAPVTQEDGKNFASLTALCREIENENTIAKYFKYYKLITPYGGYNCNACNRFNGTCYTCGTGDCLVGFLPHDMVSACHEGFTLLVDKYKEFAAHRSEEGLSVTLNKFFELSATPMCLTDDQYIQHERKMQYINEFSNVQTTNATVLIIALAMAGLIERQYLNEEKALYAAKYILFNTSYCIKANYATTGSFIMEPVGLYVLILNGALQNIDRGECYCGSDSK